MRYLRKLQSFYVEVFNTRSVLCNDMLVENFIARLSTLEYKSQCFQDF
jgi:hypothetical protein